MLCLRIVEENLCAVMLSGSHHIAGHCAIRSSGLALLSLPMHEQCYFAFHSRNQIVLHVADLLQSLNRAIQSPTLVTSHLSGGGTAFMDILRPADWDAPITTSGIPTRRLIATKDL